MVSQVLSITDLVFEGVPVRLARNGQLWFVLADVCQALELTHPHKTAERLDQDEKGSTTIPTLGGPQEMLIVSEPGLYKLIATAANLLPSVLTDGLGMKFYPQFARRALMVHLALYHRSRFRPSVNCSTKN